MARILICDDAGFMRMTIKEALEKAGHEVIGEAESAEDAIKKYSKLKPDIVTMDLLMKESGVRAIKKIKAKDPKARIIVVTVLNQQEADVVEAIRAGAQGLVSKPIKREALIAEVERVLNL